MGVKRAYHAYQQVVDMKQLQPIIKRTMRPNIKKTRSGCLNCKRRKKKCDEEKPRCKACVRNSLECIWPQHVTSSSNPGTPGITPGELINQPGKSNGQSSHFILSETLLNPLSETHDINLNNRLNTIFNLNDDFILEQFLDILKSHENFKLTEVKEGSSINTYNLPIINPSSNTSPESVNISPGVQMTEKEQPCYEAFLSFLINLLTYSHCHPKVTPTILIIPFIKYPLVKEVILACGASWLAYCDDSFQVEASERYNSVIRLIIKELKDPKANYMDHVFVCVQLLQALCLINQNIGFNLTLSAAHFSSAYAIIKKRFLQHTLPKSKTDHYLHLTTPLSRLLMENFILFYPLDIMLCHSSKLKESVPSPFAFFGRFYHILKRPIQGYENQDVWASHPITGIGLKAYELSSKCAWICRFIKLPIPEDDLLTYFSLLAETTYEIDQLSSLLKKPDLKTSHRENIYFVNTILYACLIILKKVCYYNETTTESLQDTVDLLIHQEKTAREINPNGISLIWTLFIGASTSTTVEQKKFFSEVLRSMANKIHSSICFKILNYLNIVWAEEAEGNSVGYIGFEFLFDTSVLDMISV